MAAPKAEDICDPVFAHLYDIYDDVLRAFYQDKVKGDDKKREEALKDDNWRYCTLPEQLKGRRKGLTKAELERLVRWKITHQTNRPFLLAQIRKNDDETVEKCTFDAQELFANFRCLAPRGLTRPGPTHADIGRALKKVCELNGVGPATGTLILSVYDHHIPFFEDELFAWLHPEHSAKLKYSTEEYFQMLRRLEIVEKTPLAPNFACMYEKVAFVSQHWDYVTAEAKHKIKDLIKQDKEEPRHERPEYQLQYNEGRGAAHINDLETVTKPSELKAKSKERKRKVNAMEEKPAGSKRSKRSKK